MIKNNPTAIDGTIIANMVDRRHRRNDAIGECIAANGNDSGYADLVVEYADYVDAILAHDELAVPSVVEYVNQFTRDYPADRDRLKRNLQAILAAL